MAGNQDTQLDDILGAIQASKNSQATHAPPPERPRDPRLFDRFWNSLGTQWTGLNDEGEPVPMLETKQEEPVWDPFDPNATQKIVQGHEPVLSLGTRTLPEQLKSTFNGDLLDENASPALQRLNEIESKTRAKAGLDAPQGLAENLAENAGMLVGQLPLPGDMLSSAVQKLPTAARYALAAPAAVADFFGPTFHPSAKNLASGTAAGLGIQGAMDAWLEHQQANKDAKWGPLQDSMDRYHQDLFRRAREGKITAKEADYLLSILDTSGSGEDILDEPDPNEVPPVPMKKAKGGRVRKAKGGKIKPPTMTKLGLRERLAQLMSDAQVQGTGKEVVPSPEASIDAPTLTNLPTVQSPDLPNDTLDKLASAQVSRRDVLKGLGQAAISMASPVKISPLEMLSAPVEETLNANMQKVAEAVAPRAATLTPPKMASLLQRTWDNILEGSEDSPEVLSALAGKLSKIPALSSVASIVKRAADLENSDAASMSTRSKAFKQYEQDWKAVRMDLEDELPNAAEDVGVRAIGPKKLDIESQATHFTHLTPEEVAGKLQAAWDHLFEHSEDPDFKSALKELKGIPGWAGEAEESVKAFHGDYGDEQLLEEMPNLYEQHHNTIKEDLSTAAKEHGVLRLDPDATDEPTKFIPVHGLRKVHTGIGNEIMEAGQASHASMQDFEREMKKLEEGYGVSQEDLDPHLADWVDEFDRTYHDKHGTTKEWEDADNAAANGEDD